MRRLLITIEREQTIELDEQKTGESIGNWLGLDKEPTPSNFENRIAREIESGEANVDSIHFAMGTDDGFDKYADTRVEIELQEKCEKHDEWYALSPKRLAGCWQCANERRKQ